MTVRRRIKTSKKACDDLQYERDIALQALARGFRTFELTARKHVKTTISACDALHYGRDVALNALSREISTCEGDVRQAFDELEMTSEEVEEFARDGKGPIDLRLDADSEEEETSEEEQA